MKKANYLNLYYDQEADVLYFSKGQPSANDISDEASDEVIVRKDPKTNSVTGFTILNFSKKSKNSNKSIALPLEIDLKQLSFA